MDVVVTPFDESQVNCPKCGYDDIQCKYRKPGGGGYSNEHLVLTCTECEFQWRTKTKDAK